MGKKYFIFGDGGHAKVVLDVVLSNKLTVSGIIDDQPKSKDLFNIPVYANKDYIYDENVSFIVAIGNNKIRKNIVETHNFYYYKCIHPTASFSEYAEVAEGTVVMPMAVVNAGAKIGAHCIVNSGSVVEHDCVLEDYVHISPNAALGGNVRVGEGTHIGIGASVIQGIKIGKWATVSAGAVIIKDVPDFATIVGNPGKIIKFNNFK